MARMYDVVLPLLRYCLIIFPNISENLSKLIAPSEMGEIKLLGLNRSVNTVTLFSYKLIKDGNVNPKPPRPLTLLLLISSYNLSGRSKNTFDTDSDK